MKVRWSLKASRYRRGAQRCQRRFQDWFGISAVPRAIAEANCIVERFASKIDAVVVDRNAQGDVRMTGREAFEPFDQPSGRERAHNADIQCILEAPLGEAIKRCPNLIEGFRKYGDQALPVVRQRQPPWQSVE